MKQFLKKALLPLAVFVVAVVSAFAMDSKAAPEQSQPLYTGAICYFQPITGACTNAPTINPVTADCTLEVTPIVCTFNIPGVGNVILRTCTPDLAHPGQWLCTAALYKRTMPSP